MTKLFIHHNLRYQCARTHAFGSFHLLTLLLMALTVFAAAPSSFGQSTSQDEDSTLLRDNVLTLRPGELLTRAINGTERHTFLLPLAPKQYVHVVVEQQGVNVVVRLLD